MFLRCIASFIISIHMIKISTSERPRAKRGRAEFAATFQLGRHLTLQHIVQRRQVGCSWKLKPALAVQHVCTLYGYSALMIFLRKERAGEQKISAKVDGGKNERSAKKKVEEEEEDIRVREVGKRGRDGGKCGSGRKNSALARRARRQDSSSSNPDQPQPGARQSENSRQVC